MELHNQTATVSYSVAVVLECPNRGRTKAAFDRDERNMVSCRGRPYVKSGPILSDVEREPDNLGDAEVRFGFSPAMRRVITDSTY